MGNFPVKSTTEEQMANEKCDLSCEGEGKTQLEGDPRSPSIDIDRTPLQKQVLKAKPITKNVALTKECFEKYGETAMNPAIRALMNKIDPRSPTFDFQRTPLGFVIQNTELIKANNELNSSNFLSNGDSLCSDTLNDSSTGIVSNLSPKNLCEDLCNLSVSDNNQESFTTDLNLENQYFKGEDLLTSALPENNEMIQPIYGLLETNLDYVETDLDTVRRKRKVIVAPQVAIEETDLPPEDPLKEKKIDSDTDLSDKDPRSPTIGIDRTPILITESKQESKLISSKKANSQMKEVFKNNVKLQQKKHSDEKSQEKDNIRKITDSLLIYEDNFADDKSTSTSKKTILNHNNEGSRTPLASMINIDKTHPNSKQNTPSNDSIYDINTKVNKSSNVKSKIPIRISKTSPSLNSDIKVLKSRRILGIYSENTPPQPRKACWDTDLSVVL